MKAEHCPLRGGSCVSICPFEELPFYNGHTRLPLCSGHHPLSPFSREARAALHCISVGLCVAELRDGKGPRAEGVGSWSEWEAAACKECRPATW